MNQLQVFKNPEFGEVRWIKIYKKDYAVTRHCNECVKHAVGVVTWPKICIP
jgi:hypothetical protein